MKFSLDVDLPDGPEAADELGRILRYWGGAMKHLDTLQPGDRQDVYDSSYTEVGAWEIRS